MTTLDGVRDEMLGYLRAGISVALLGLPGAGRTTVVRSTIESLVATGWNVVEVRGLAGLADRPLEALAVAGLVGQPGGPQRERGPVAAAVDAVRRAMSSDRSVLVVDDVQDLDSASIGVISAALGARRAPLLSSAATTWRPAPLSLPTMVRPAVRLIVPPLAYDDTREIMEGICGRSIHTSTVAAVHALAGGLPALVHAITENAQRRGLMTRGDGMRRLIGDPWTPHLAMSIAPYIQGLSPSAADGLVKLAYVGAVEAAVAGQLVSDPDLEELDDCGLLTFSANAESVLVSVYPPLLAEHLARDRLSARRIRVLDEISAALNGDGVHTLDALHNLSGLRVGGPTAGPEVPLPTSEMHAMDLDMGAGNTVAGSASLAARIAPTSIPPTSIHASSIHASSIHTDVVHSGIHTDGLRSGGIHLETPDRQSQVVTDAVLNRLIQDHRRTLILVRRAEWEKRRDVRTAAALAWALMLRSADADELDKILDVDVRADDFEGVALLALRRASCLAFLRRDLAGAVALLAETVPKAGTWGPLVEAFSDHLTLLLAHVPAHPPPTEVSDVPIVAGVQRMTAAERLLAAGRPAEAIKELDRVVDPDEDTWVRCEVLRGVALVLSGHLDRALDWALPRYDQGRSRFDPAVMIGHGYVVALVYVFRGDDQALRTHLGQLLAVGVTPIGFSHYHLGTLVIATRLAALAGRPWTARSMLEQAEAMGLPDGPFPLMVTAQAEEHTALAEGIDATRVAAELWSVSDNLLQRGYVAAAVMTAVRAVILVPEPAGVAKVATFVQDADSALLSGLVRYAGALTEDPDTRLQVGSELVAAGLVGYGIELQVSAVRALTGTDPDRAAIQSRRLLELTERLGGSYRQLVDPIAPRSVLTRREREVAEMAVSGLNNVEIAGRLVVSVRTVENHLHRAFHKLGVQSRSGLADALNRNP